MHLLNSHGLYHDMRNPLKNLHFNALDADFISIHVSKNSIRLKQYLDEYLTQFGWIFIATLRTISKNCFCKCIK